MFCTVCATVNSVAAACCAACGASFARQPAGLKTHARLSRHTLLRILYAVPLLVALMFALATVEQRLSAESAAAALYERGEAASAEGRYDLALDAFTAAAGFRDADARRDEVLIKLAPYRAAYLDGLTFLDAGDSQAAIEALLPVARDLPDYQGVTARLAEARRGRVAELRREADAAATRREWFAAERALVALAAIDPTDPTVAERLATLQREHGAIVFARDRALYTIGPDGADEHLVTDAVPVIYPNWSPDRTRIAFVSADAEDATGNVGLYVVNVDGTGLTRLADRVAYHTSPLWSPDGARLAFTSFADYDMVHDQGVIGVHVVEVATGVERDVSGAGLPLAFNPSWSPGGDRLAFVSKDQQYSRRPQSVPGDVEVVTLATGAVTNLTNGQVHDVWSVHWSPVADQILVYSLYGSNWYEPPETAIRLLDVATGSLQLLSTPPEVAYTPVWSPDGTHFAFVEGKATIRIRWLAGDERRVELPEETSGRLTWAPDGTVLLAAGLATKPSMLVPLEEPMSLPRAFSLQYDSDPPFVGPPQWAPISRPPRSGPPSFAGTGLDRG